MPYDSFSPVPDLSVFTAKYGPDEGWRRWAVANSRKGFNVAVPDLGLIRQSIGLPQNNPGLVLPNFPFNSPTAPSTTDPTTPPPAVAPPPGTTDPTVKAPNFITPYVKPTGFGAYGEKDVF